MKRMAFLVVVSLFLVGIGALPTAAALCESNAPVAPMVVASPGQPTLTWNWYQRCPGLAIGFKTGFGSATLRVVSHATGAVLNCATGTATYSPFACTGSWNYPSQVTATLTVTGTGVEAQAVFTNVWT